METRDLVARKTLQVGTSSETPPEQGNPLTADHISRARPGVEEFRGHIHGPWATPLNSG